MVVSRFDVLVVGAGPAGSVAATVLARAGARVALLDKAAFPRDKACGDLIGPRGVQLLYDLDLPVPDGPEVGTMLVVGPAKRTVRMPAAPGLTYPGHGVVATRTAFDGSLHLAATDAGAVAIAGRAETPLWSPDGLDGFHAGPAGDIRADYVIGADGATSRVAAVAGLVDPSRVLWGFALRAYAARHVPMAAIVLWEPSAWRAFPGYGWAFPGADGGANLGLGIATRSDRQAGAGAVRAFPAFLDHLQRVGLVDGIGPEAPSRRLGGWLKMGMVGTNPAAGRVLLVGDAAGLVNPLQGEGIAQAMQSGRWAAEAIVGRPAGPAGAHADVAARYRARLVGAHLPYHRIAAALQGAVVGRPRAVAGLTRLLTAAGQGDAVAGGWAVFWNELLDGAPAGAHRGIATLATRVGQVLSRPTATARWFDATFS